MVVAVLEVQACFVRNFAMVVEASIHVVEESAAAVVVEASEVREVEVLTMEELEELMVPAKENKRFFLLIEHST